MKRKQLLDNSTSPPPKKKVKLSSYEYLNNLNNLQHERNKVWMPVKPDFKELATKYPSFAKFTYTRGESIKVNWKETGVLHTLCEVLLLEYFNMNTYFPRSNLAPTITLRMNYIHWIYDLLPIEDNNDITGIDIGTGASCIYPLLGVRIYNWNFLATDIDSESIKYAEDNIKKNSFENKIETKLVETNQQRKILIDVIKPLKKYDFCMCNPPFFDSLDKANVNPKRECAATSLELVTEGGEFSFVNQIIEESIILKDTIKIYTSMIGRKVNFNKIKAIIRDNEYLEILKTTEFCQGRQVRWGIAWKTKKQKIT